MIYLLSLLILGISLCIILTTYSGTNGTMYNTEENHRPLLWSNSVDY